MRAFLAEEPRLLCGYSCSWAVCEVKICLGRSIGAVVSCTEPSAYHHMDSHQSMTQLLQPAHAWQP